MTSNRAYIGDGVYASHDGYHIWLSTDREGGTHSIALDPYVYRALIDYHDSIAGRPEQDAGGIASSTEDAR